MKSIIFFSIAITSLCVSCSTLSDFPKFYKAYSSPEERGYHVIRLGENEEPKIYSTNDIDTDLFGLISDHYVCVGETSFNGPSNEIENEIINQCKENGATIAIYSIVYTDTRYGSSYYKGSGGSYSIQRYDYTIYYLVKFTDDVGLGLDLIDIDSQRQKMYKRNTGAFVNIVYKKSIAFYANIIRGDIIIKVDGNDVLDSESCYRALFSKPSGASILLEIIRDGETIAIELRIK